MSCPTVDDNMRHILFFEDGGEPLTQLGCAVEIGVTDHCNDSYSRGRSVDLDSEVVLWLIHLGGELPAVDADETSGSTETERRVRVSWARVATYEIDETPSVDPGITLAALAGELDLTNAQELAEQLDEELVQDETALVLDLNRVVFIDSAALHCLFRLARKRGPAGLAFVIEPPLRPSQRPSKSSSSPEQRSPSPHTTTPALRWNALM